MTRKANAAAQNASSKPAQTDDDVDKIRDIIFGGQMREYAAQFERLELHVKKSIESMSKQMSDRLEKMEQTIKAKTDALDAQLKKQGETVAVQLGERDTMIDEQLEAIDESLNATYEELTAAIEKSQAQLAKTLATDAKRLERDKVETKDLAQLFIELGRQLKQNGQ